MEKSRIKKIYDEYFQLIESYFGSIKHHLRDSEDSHIDLGIDMANYPLISDLIIDAIHDLDTEIDTFWRQNARDIFSYIKKQPTLKCIYSGDISPVVLENFVKKSALYVDTVIVPDPIYNLSLFHKKLYVDKKYYLSKLIRHVFNIWKLKDLVLADSKEDILLIMPISLYLVGKDKSFSLLEQADKSYIDYVNNFCSLNLKDKDEVFAFLDTIESTELLFGAFKNPRILPTPFQEPTSLDNFLRSFTEQRINSPFGERSIAWNFGLYLQSQFIRVQEHKYFCEVLSAEPIYDYELPWFFYTYELGGPDIDAGIANSLQMEKFQWLTKVPIKALKAFREEGTLDYMRNILRHGITDLKAKSDKNLTFVSEQLEKNMNDAFKQQSGQISDLEKKVKKITNLEIPLTTTGFLAGFIPVVGNIVSLCMAGRDIKKYLKERREAKESLSEKRSSAINLLMRTRNE